MSQPALISGPIHQDASQSFEHQRKKLQLEIDGLKADLSEVRRQRDVMEAALRNLRAVLSPLFLGLKAVFGEIEATIGSDDGFSHPENPQGTMGPKPHNRQAWDAWKQQLPPACGRIIDALFVQPLMASQIATICKMHYDTATKSLAILSRNGLIEKDGNLNRLRRI